MSIAGAVWPGMTVPINLCDKSKIMHHILQLSIHQHWRSAGSSLWRAHDM